MMSAARVAGRMRYQKRTTASPNKNLKKRASSSTCVLNGNTTKETGKDGPEKKESTKNDHPTPSGNNSLTVPEMPMRKRSGSVPALKIFSLAVAWNIKPSQVRGLKLTWARLCEPPRSNCKGIVGLVERVWEKLDAKDKNIREIFYRAAFVDSMTDRCERRRSNTSIATIRDHTHFFVSLVSQTVQNLDNDPTEIFAHIDKIGRNHAYLKQYGFKSTHWEKVGEYFIDTVVVQDCVRSFPEASKAWTVLVAALVDRLRAAPRRGSFGGIVPKDVDIASSVRIFGSGNVLCPHMNNGSGPSSRRSSIIDLSSTSPPKIDVSPPEKQHPCISLSSLSKALPDLQPTPRSAMA